ncbi:MAG: hypothetical protein HC807_05140, partial [Gammaproteobacteria bacterium]|nr:hypothetical protein [Gammaproteobacteria bacterium]
LFVTGVSEDGPADRAGVRRGDVVLAVGPTWSPRKPSSTARCGRWGRPEPRCRSGSSRTGKRANSESSRSTGRTSSGRSQ